MYNILQREGTCLRSKNLADRKRGACSDMIATVCIWYFFVFGVRLCAPIEIKTNAGGGAQLSTNTRQNKCILTFELVDQREDSRSRAQTTDTQYV